MAKNNQTFKAVLKLQAEQFKKEANSVKKTLGSLQKSFMGFAAAMGAGLGFAQLITNIRKTVTDLSVARATLENVSKATAEFTNGTMTASVVMDNYAQNLKYLDGLAKAYKQDIITLTDGFAKFSAAATTANVSIQDQRYIFQELTKAATYFHMSGDRTQQMMVAIEQMFSKGKVTSEELRRQLGNNLPGAFGIMAKAIGVSNAELDKMLKNGEVLASDALPKFARELSKMTTGNISLDSIQLLQNELRNAWVDLVDSAPFEQLYKAILKFTTSVIKNFKTLEKTILGTLGIVASRNFFKWGTKNWEEYTRSIKRQIALQNTELKKQQATFTSITGKQANGAIMAKLLHSDVSKYTPQQQQQLLSSYMAIQKAESEIAVLTDKITVGTSRWDKAIRGVKVAFANIGAILKSFAWMAAIEGAMMLWGKIQDIRREWERIRNISKDFNKELDAINRDASQSSIGIKEAQSQINGFVEQLEKVESGSTEWKTIIQEINSLLGLTEGNEIKVGDGIDTIKKKAEEWADLQRDILRNQWAIGEEFDAENRLFDLRQQQKSLDRNKNPRKARMIDEEITQQDERRRRAQAIINETSARITAAKTANATPTAEPKTGKTDFQKVVEKQKEALKELENQFKAGAYTEEEYRKKKDELVVSTFEAITAFDKFKDKLRELGAGSWFDDIASQFAYIKLAIDDNVDEIEDYDEAMKKLASDMYEATNVKQDKYQWSNIPDRGHRDSTFDYKKTKSSILGEELDLTKEQLDYVTEAIEKAREEAKKGITEAAIDLANLQNELNGLQKEVTDLNDKMVLAQLQEDIEGYQKQMFDGIANGIKSTATAMDRLVSSTQTMMDTLQNPDATAWEQIMSVFNEIVQVFDTITGLVELFNTLTTISNTLGEAKSTLLAKQNLQREQELGLVGALSTAEVAEGVAAAQAATVKATAYKISQAALTNMAFAAGAANSMSVPYPYNLAALASNQAAITEMILAGKALAAFAEGGIVGGNSTTGDRNLVRVNSGELILNKAQQGNLFSLLNGKGKLGGGEVQFKIRGADLVGTLNNYNSKIRG